MEKLKIKEKEIIALWEAHRKAENKRDAGRINAVYLLANAQYNASIRMGKEGQREANQSQHFYKISTRKIKGTSAS